MLVTGGAGFLGSHVCERLLDRGDEVICVDNLSTGILANVNRLLKSDRFSMLYADVAIAIPVRGPIDKLLHLASPASPPHYLAHPLETLEVNSRGTQLCLELAAQHHARLLLASTSEVYGEPACHPQSEDYWGNVSPIGPRSVYDEGKRFAEALVMAWQRLGRTNAVIARLFNTYGPRLRPDDGRVISNFLSQALSGRELTVYGDGAQTRSFCFVDDTVTGLLALLDSGMTGPVNIGNADEHTVLELANLVRTLCGTSAGIRYESLPADDPSRRCPDIRLAKDSLGWKPKITLSEGLQRTAEWMRRELGLGQLTPSEHG